MPGTARGIQLPSDCLVDPARDQEFIDAWRNESLPRVSRTPGFVEGRLLRLRRANVGDQPMQVNYRFVQVFESKKPHHAGSESPEHVPTWTPLEKPLPRPRDTRWLFTALLRDEQ